MPDIKITISGYDDVAKRVDGLEKAFKDRPSDFSKDFSKIKSMLSERGDFSPLEKRLGRIESLIKDLLSAQKKHGKMMEGMEVEAPEVDMSGVEKMMGRHTSQILKALDGKQEARVSLRPIQTRLDEMEDTLIRKLSRLSLPKNLVIMDKRPQIVPSPS